MVKFFCKFNLLYVQKQESSVYCGKVENVYVHTLDDAEVKTDLTERGREGRARVEKRERWLKLFREESRNTN